MSSPCRASVIALALVALSLAACDREERRSRGKPLPETAPLAAESGPLAPGDELHAKLDPRAAAYEQNAQALAEGQQLFGWMNCSGCHSHGGGGMGPPLMDDKWRYGGRIDQIAATIVNGRPNGMPSFRDKLTADQVWKIAAFVRTLSGQVRKDAVAGRADEISNTEPLTLTEREAIQKEVPLQ